jgi:hypothetical protein
MRIRRATRLLIWIASWLLCDDTAAAASEHIRRTVLIAGWPERIADAVIAAGVGRHEAARMFAQALRQDRVQ